VEILAWAISQLLHMNFLLEETAPEGVHSAKESDVNGNHVSTRWKCLTAGDTWEPYAVSRRKRMERRRACGFWILPVSHSRSSRSGPAVKSEEAFCFSRRRKSDS
jgi:hypothetical protein